MTYSARVEEDVVILIVIEVAECVLRDYPCCMVRVTFEASLEHFRAELASRVLLGSANVVVTRE